MDTEPGLAEAAELFKVLGNASRLTILRIIGDDSSTVGALVAATGMSQPLVSQHLRTLRHAGLVTASRSGKEIGYRLADLHVAHVIADAVTHAQEPTLSDDPDIHLDTPLTRE
ncbi:ArsR/SmtB family transcription factor [Microbacterium flavum]|uniref:ArsR/SmtB family transcription factor n=1 Tax=Microbacterium flavum TaxID=415216 RepID=UPI0024ADB560|nr:metalloregulator ArsR/SmtB family transcription factor [Microbacterium flavum]